MGHGANDKLYITHAEHSGALGQHSASGGYKQKAEGPLPGALVPFDCCALSLQPFEHPVLARSNDGTGTVFDLLNIVPWLKEHKNTHPITKEPLSPDDLIALHYSRNSDNQLIDPVTFKIFSEHSHIVAIATTGNVFLSDSLKLFAASGKDPVSEENFKKDDIVTLQDPHNFALIKPASTADPTKPDLKKAPNEAGSSKTGTKLEVPAASEPGPSSTKMGVIGTPRKPYNISPYSTGNTGASLTSTSIAPMTTSSVALFDEEELMYDEISTVRKEKEIAKKRAYVRMVTNLGGSLNLELFCEKAPKTCYNFLMLARQGKYDDCPFHRLIPGFMIQGGDPTGTGRGGESYWGTPFRDEYDLKGAEKHTERGMLSMANKGFGTNGSQFFITFGAKPHLDGKHTVFGKLVGGEDILDAIERIPVKPKTDTPTKDIRIKEVVIYADPFEDYKQRLAKKLQSQGQTASGSSILPQGVGAPMSAPAPAKKRKERDDVNWFGVKLNEKGKPDVGTASTTTTAGGGIGKYLNASTPPGASSGSAPAAALVVDPKKKRKLGFGNFDAW